MYSTGLGADLFLGLGLSFLSLWGREVWRCGGGEGGRTLGALRLLPIPHDSVSGGESYKTKINKIDN